MFITVASCISVKMPGDFKVVCIRQEFCFHIDKVPLYKYSTLTSVLRRFVVVTIHWNLSWKALQGS